MNGYVAVVFWEGGGLGLSDKPLKNWHCKEHKCISLFFNNL